ncbi:MAG: hypothetical protein IIT72_00875, partial [Lachnospiraceae bacterium]|nr:hypothetical protein [Lachnospiraceae bacterium]
MEQEKHGWERLILDQTLAEDSEIVIGSGAVHILLLDPTLWSYRQIQTEMRNLVTNQRLYRLLKGNAYTYTEDLRAIRRFQDEFGLVLHRIPWIKD